MNTVEQKLTSVPPSPLSPSPAKPPAANHPGSAKESGKSAPKLGRWVVVIAILVAAGLIFGVVPRWLHRRALVKETQDLSISSVILTSAIPGKATSSLLLPAEVHAFEEAPIYARASGYIKRWYVDIGGSVTAGQLLADIDAPEVDQQLTESKAQLAQAESAQALAKITADRWSELLKTASVSEQENAEKQADLTLKIATVDASKANVNRLEDMESFTHVVAPFAGALTARDIDVGDLISPGKELFRLAETRKLRVFVRVPQTATLGITVGVNAEMTVPEMPARVFPAKVVRTAGAIDASSRTLLTELEVDNSNNELLAGSYAQVSFADLKQEAPLILPANTLLFRAEGMQVGVVDANGKVQLKNLAIGRDFGKTVEVLAGITAADKIIVNPADSLTSGVTVRIVDDSAAETAK